MASAAPQSQAIAPRDNSPIAQFQRQLEARADELRMALPQGIGAEKFQRTIVTAVAQNPALLKADRQSLILSIYKAAQDGLLPDGREAALVTFNTRFKDPEDGQWKSKQLVQYMPMVYGLRKKILQAKDADGNPIVSALQVGVVYRAEVKNGYFLWERGSDPEIQHRPMLELSAEEAADSEIVAAYSIATMRDGTRSCEVMRRFEIDQVRQMSQTGAVGRTDRSGKAIEPKGPWVDWPAEMAKKTVMRRHAKTLPMSGDVIAELGGEDDQVLARRSAVGALSMMPDEPQLITDESGDQIDGETGEIVGNTGDDQAGDQPAKLPEEAAAETQPARRGRPPKADQAKPEKAEQPEASDPPAAEQAEDPGRDELGITKDAAEAQADEFLGRFAKAEIVADLKSIHAEFEKASEGWPYDIVSVCENGYARHLKRLGAPAPAAQPELAQ